MLSFPDEGLTSGGVLADDAATLRDLGLAPDRCSLILKDTDASSLGNTVFDEVTSR